MENVVGLKKARLSFSSFISYKREEEGNFLNGELKKGVERERELRSSMS